MAADDFEARASRLKNAYPDRTPDELLEEAEQFFATGETRTGKLALAAAEHRRFLEDAARNWPLADYDRDRSLTPVRHLRVVGDDPEGDDA